MRILVIGAGATGGYFGGRLLEAGRDVTFLVRPRRAAQLAEHGLAVVSPVGNIHIPDPPRVTAAELRTPFDLVLLSCKAYDLDDAIASFAPAVGPNTAILPLLNGMKHLDALDAKFGAQAVLGGQCVISGALDADGRVLHLNDAHAITFGDRAPPTASRVASILAALRGAKFDVRASEAIVQEMWDKWVFIATGASLTCLMRASVGDIVAAGATDFPGVLFDECAAIARASGFPCGDAVRQRTIGMLTRAGSPLTASMLRDLERGGRTEVEQILGDLLARRTARPSGTSLLEVACTHLRAYEVRRAREAKP
jgi:2-dehydropantoate 2-reductase